jgi:hypothetical protein
VSAVRCSAVRCAWPTCLLPLLLSAHDLCGAVCADSSSQLQHSPTWLPCVTCTKTSALDLGHVHVSVMHDWCDLVVVCEGPRHVPALLPTGELVKLLLQ